MVESTERTSTSTESETALSLRRAEDAAGGRADSTGVSRFTDPRRTGGAGGRPVGAFDAGSRTAPVTIVPLAPSAPSPGFPSLKRSVLRQSQRMAIARAAAT